MENLLDSSMLKLPLLFEEPHAILESSANIVISHTCFSYETQNQFMFRLHSSDGSEFLFREDSEEKQQEWVKKIKFHAGLAHSQPEDNSGQEIPGNSVTINEPREDNEEEKQKLVKKIEIQEELNPFQPQVSPRQDTIAEAYLKQETPGDIAEAKKGWEDS